MLGWWSRTISACASPGWCLGFKVFQPGLHPSGTTPEKGPSPGPPWPGHLWALWSHPVAGRKQMPTFLSGRKCCHNERHIFSNEKRQSEREGRIFPLPRKDDQSGKDAGHPATLCQASAYHSDPQQVNKCSVLSLSNSNSPFIWDGGHIHPTNARPTVAWQGTEQVLAGARLTPEPGHDEGEGDGHPSSRDHFRSHELLVPDTPHLGGWLRGIPPPLPPAEEGFAQPALRAAALLLPPPSPGKPQPPGLGEVLKT